MERYTLNQSVRGRNAYFSIFLYKPNLKNKSISFMMEKTFLNKENKSLKARYQYS